MSDAPALLRSALAAAPFAARALDVRDDGDDALVLTSHGATVSSPFTLHAVAVPALAALLAEGRWIDATVPADALAASPRTSVVVIVGAAGEAVWGTAAELSGRASAPSDGSVQVRLSVFSGLAGAGTHRLLLALAAPAALAAVEQATGASPRLRTLLRRFLDDGEAFDASVEDVCEAGIPASFTALFGDVSASTVRFAAPILRAPRTIALRTATAAMSVHDGAVACLRAGLLRETWETVGDDAAVAFTLQTDHRRNALEVRAALRAASTSATTLAAATRFVWRFGQGGHLAVAPASDGAGVEASTTFGAQDREPVALALLETLDVLAELERESGARFALDPTRLRDPAEAAAIRDLVNIRTSGLLERDAASMRLSLPAAEVCRLLATNGFQRRVFFRLPASRATRSVCGVTVSLGTRVQEVRGRLVTPPRDLYAAASALSADDPVDVELSDVELRERYGSAADPSR